MTNTATYSRKYSICSTDGHRVLSDTIVAEFGRQGKPVPEYLAEILTNGIRYSFQDFDTLSAALRELAPLSEAKELWARLAEKDGK